MSTHFLSKLANITCLAFDVDGVFTDGTVTIMPDGAQLRKMMVKDGYALQQAMKAGLRVVIITGGREPSVEKRFNYLGVQDVYLGATDKLNTLDEYLLTWDVAREEVLYMGDDLPDYEVMQYAGLTACPADAAKEIIAISDYVSDKKGGFGCVRDVLEKLLQVQGQWFSEENAKTDSTSS